MLKLRRYLPIVLLCVAACSPSVSGQVVFQNPATTSGQKSAVVGVHGMEVELYLVKSFGAKKSDTNRTSAPVRPITEATTNNNTTNNAGSATTTSDTPVSKSAKAVTKANDDEEGDDQNDDDKDADADDDDKADDDAADDKDDDQVTDDITPTTEPTTQPGSTIPTNLQTSPPAEGTLIATQMTNNKGSFFFGDIEPGEYEIRLGDSVWNQGYRLVSQSNPIRVTTALKGSAKNRFAIYRLGLEAVDTNCPERMPYPMAAVCEQTYQNTSPSVMQGVAIAANLPAKLDVDPLYGGARNHATRQMVWNVQIIQPGESIKVGFVIIPQLPKANEEELQFTWVVQSAGDVHAAPAGEIHTTITTIANATLAIQGDRDADPGDAVTYDLVVNNDGTRPLVDAELVFSIPDSLTLINIDGGIFQPDEDLIRWKLNTVQMNSDVTRTVKLKLPPLAPSKHVLKYAATLTSPTLGHDNVSAAHSVLVSKNVDVELQVKTDPIKGAIDGDFTWTVTVKQEGGATLQNAKILAEIDARIDFDEDASGGGAFNDETNMVTWNLGSLPSNAMEVVTFHGKPDKNTADVGDTLSVTISFVADGLNIITHPADILLD